MHDPSAVQSAVHTPANWRPFSTSHVFLLLIATGFLAMTYFMPGSVLSITALMVSLIAFSFARSGGQLILPGALVGVFAPLRVLGSILANRILSGPLDTTSFMITAEATILAASVIYLLVIFSNLAVPNVEIDLLQPMSREFRQVCWLLLCASTLAFIVRAGGVPILREDAEASRIVAQSGAAVLVFAALVSAVALAVDLALRRTLQGFPIRMVLVLMGTLSLALVIGGSRLPLLMAIYAYVATVVSVRRARGESTLGMLVGAPLLMLTLAVGVGAWRASYVRWDKGLLGAVEHFLRRSGADAGNMQLLFDRDVTSILSLREYLIAPFGTYLPGAQRNLGQLLKDRLGLVFEGGGITAPMPVEAYGLLGSFGIVVIPCLASLIVVGSAVIQRNGMVVTERGASALWLGTFFGFINLGAAGLIEFLASSWIPFVVIGFSIYTLGSSFAQLTARVVRQGGLS